MFSLAPSRLILLLTLLAIYAPSLLARDIRSLRKRDALSDSGLSLASWIWLPEPDLLTTAPTGSVALIKNVTTTGKAATSASIAITVDNNFTLWVNGQPIGDSDGVVISWQDAQIFTAALNASSNVFSVLGTNIGAGPAGLLAAIQIFFTDGSNETVLSDNTWLASGSIPADFPLPTDLSSFVQAEVATQYGSGPWGTSVTIPNPTPNPLKLTGSAWIWSTPGASTSAAPGTVGFRKTIISPIGKTATSAIVLATADNTFQLFVNGQYVGAPPFDNNAVGEIPSWEYAQRFTVALTPTTNIFTVLATNFPAEAAGGGPSSAGLVTALQIVFSDGSNEIVRTDTSWLTGNVTTASAFLGAADSTLSLAISSGLFGIAPWDTLNGVSDVLSALPANDAESSPSPSSIPSPSPPPPTPFPFPAPTSMLPSNPTTSTQTPNNGGGHSLPATLGAMFSLSIMAFCIL